MNNVYFKFGAALLGAALVIAVIGTVARSIYGAPRKETPVYETRPAPNRVGPNLFAVVIRPKASIAGFDYSAAMKAQGGTWTYAELDRFLSGPQAAVPGTKMTFMGVPDPIARANLVAYLRTLADTPA